MDWNKYKLIDQRYLFSRGFHFYCNYDDQRIYRYQFPSYGLTCQIQVMIPSGDVDVRVIQDGHLYPAFTNCDFTHKPFVKKLEKAVLRECNKLKIVRIYE